MRLQGKFALVTGASTGIGRAIAVRFAEEGASVAINYYKSPDEAEETAKACRAAHADKGLADAKAIVVKANVAEEEAVEAMFKQTLDAFGRLDILVNNSGIQTHAPSEEMDMAAFDRVVGVNLRGAYMCARAALQHFLARGGGGVILNDSSVHEIIPKPEYVSYSISKGGMQNLTRTLALEYAGRGIRVNAVGPGAVSTPINDSWRHDEKARAEVESHIPLGRVAEPEEIAAVFAFLASDDASYITGQTIFACGGLTVFPEYRGTWAS